MAEREYKRLTRARARTAFGIITTSRSSLWLAKDHLLCIDMNGYTETYKRFFFRDIQAVTTRRTPGWLISSGVLGFLAALFAWFWLLAMKAGEPPLAWVMAIVGAFFLAVLALDLMLGPSCATYLRTAVQTERLPSLDRVRRVRWVLARLRPLLAEAQGQLAPEETARRLQEWMMSQATAGVSPGSHPGYVVDQPNVPPRMLP